MIPDHVQVIAFDAAGTIIAPSPPVHLAYCEVAQSFGYILDPQKIKERFPAAMQEFFPLSWNVEEARTDQNKQWCSWRKLVARVLHEIPEPELTPVFTALWEHFRVPQHWNLFTDVEPTLQALKWRGYILCVVSNFDHRLYDIAKGCPGLAAIDHWFASVDVGYQKPCVEFFRSVEQRLATESQRFLMIGDSLEADYEGAINAKWQARWLNRDTHSGQLIYEDLPRLPYLHLQTLQSLQELVES